jgi:hypothetical protein
VPLHWFVELAIERASFGRFGSISAASFVVGFLAIH